MSTNGPDYKRGPTDILSAQALKRLTDDELIARVTALRGIEEIAMHLAFDSTHEVGTSNGANISAVTTYACGRLISELIEVQCELNRRQRV